DDLGSELVTEHVWISRVDNAGRSAGRIELCHLLGCCQCMQIGAADAADHGMDKDLTRGGRWVRHVVTDFDRRSSRYRCAHHHSSVLVSALCGLTVRLGCGRSHPRNPWVHQIRRATHSSARPVMTCAPACKESTRDHTDAKAPVMGGSFVASTMKPPAAQ